MTMTGPNKEIAARLDRPVVLTGMMGAGKSHVGRLLAELLGLPFVDTDRQVEEQAGCTVAEIFRRDGEARFRAVEKAVVVSALGQGPRIIAIGGGALMDAETLAAVLNGAVSVWLKVDPAVLTQRLEKSAKAGDRPLLAEVDVGAKLRELLAVREPVYSRADIKVETVDGSAAQTAEEVVKALKEFLRA